jgi:RND superfamily putative drug exporter
MFGVMVLVFQEGNLASWFGVTPTGWIEASQPVIMVALAFGLSMDYEVFLLSRMREEWDRSHDNSQAVALGLQRTGGIITSAAVLLVVVIGAFATSGISFITMIGVGLAFAILLDATVIRALLVPATMQLLGSANWWAPGPLRRTWERFGLREGPAPAAIPTPATELVP